MLWRGVLLIAGLIGNAQAHGSEALAQANHCLSCHAMDKKVVGPAFRDVARKYAGDTQAPQRLAAKVIAGGNGSWGVVYMPANKQISPAQARLLVDWILALK